MSVNIKNIVVSPITFTVETKQGLDLKEYPRLDTSYLDNPDAELIIHIV